MPVHYIEVAEDFLHCIEAIVKSIAHSIHLSEDVPGVIHICSLVVYPVDLVVGLIVAPASKNVNFVTPSGQSFGDL